MVQPPPLRVPLPVSNPFEETFNEIGMQTIRMHYQVCACGGAGLHPKTKYLPYSIDPTHPITPQMLAGRIPTKRGNHHLSTLKRKGHRDYICWTGAQCPFKLTFREFRPRKPRQKRKMAPDAAGAEAAPKPQSAPAPDPADIPWLLESCCLNHSEDCRILYALHKAQVQVDALAHKADKQQQAQIPQNIARLRPPRTTFTTRRRGTTPIASRSTRTGCCTSWTSAPSGRPAPASPSRYVCALILHCSTRRGREL